MPANTYGRQVVLPLTNKSGGSVAAGDVVVIDTTNNEAFTTSTAGSVTKGVGVAQETIANNATGRVLIAGYAALINVNASVTRGNFGSTYTVAKQASDAGASRTTGTFCQFLTGGTTPTAYVFANPDLGGSGLTNPMTTGGDIIYGGASGVPTRLANGSAGQVLVSAGGTSAPTWGTGITFATQGTTSAGVSFATTRGTYAKKLTIASTCLVASIVAFVKGDGATREGMAGIIYSDSSGPLNIVAISGATSVDDGSHVAAVFIPNTTVRAVTFPIGYVAAAGDYWFCFWMGDLGAHLSLAFNSGTGTDKTQAITGDAARDSSVTAFSSSSNDYCISINTLR